MKSIKTTFISSTFWTERIGSVAALKTLEIMKKEKSWKKITLIGKKIISQWKMLSIKHNLNIRISGIPSLCSFSFVSNKNIAYKTYITQEMLKNNILASNVVYSSIAHNNKILKKYFKVLDEIFRNISLFEKGRDIYKYLDTKISTQNFERLN